MWQKYNFQMDSNLVAQLVNKVDLLLLQYFPNSLDDTLQSWHDDIRREFALEFAENSNQQTNWQTAVITSLSRVSVFFLLLLG